MKLTLKSKKFSLPFLQPVRIGDIEHKTREGLHIYLLDEDEDIFGVGEASPLTGISNESLETIESELQDLSNITVSVKLAKLPVFSQSPSLQWAIEAAYLDGVLAAGDAIPTQPLYMNIKQATAMTYVPSHSTIKVKVGRLDINEEKRLLEQLIIQYPNIHLRLDANQSLSLDDALFLVDGLLGRHIDYVEDPCQSTGDYETFFRQSGIPYALECYDCPEDSNFDADGLGALIYKPMLCGGVKRLYEIKRAHPELDIILSSSFESDIGLNALAKLANMIGSDKTQGFGTAHYFYNRPTADFWTVQ